MILLYEIIHIQPFNRFFFFLFFKSSYAHQGCIYLIENTVKAVIFCNIKMYNVSYFNILFSTLM